MYAVARITRVESAKTAKTCSSTSRRINLQMWLLVTLRWEQPGTGIQLFFQFVILLIGGLIHSQYTCMN